MDLERLAKLNSLESKQINAYPYSFKRTKYSSDLRNNFSELENSSQSVAGRIIQKRDFGKLSFCTLQDFHGKIQVMARADSLESTQFDFFKSFDLGDIVGVSGTVIKTQKGEISLNASNVVMLSKSLRFMPDKFKGLADTETRYRKRYLDLISNPQILNMFKTRTIIVDSIREFLNSHGYLEVDTPILQKVYGGAAAKPFTTLHNALDQQLYLRISNELYLKRLIIGGVEKVYEFSKDFRNEDIDSTHNPEFTQVEFYEAYKDYNDYMSFSQQLFLHVLSRLGHKNTLTYFDKTLDFSKFQTVSLYEKIKSDSGIDILDWADENQAFNDCVRVGVKPSKKTLAKCVDALFDHFVVPHLQNPTFVIDFPYYMCPLTKKKRDNPKLAERFELFIAGYECANCYSELTDPREQRSKLLSQSSSLEKGDEESNPLDEDFLEAMEYGMPPTAGMGIGIDRLAMIFANTNSIKEVILFPSMRD
jgi:lysyl-tRNA synthetase class 2